MKLYLHVHYWEFGKCRPRGSRCSRSCWTGPMRGWCRLSRTCSGWSSAASTRFPSLPRYQDRFPLFHVKDGIPNPAGGYFNPGFTDLGEGSIDFTRIFKALKNKNAHRYIVERDDQPDPARTARVGYEYLLNLRARTGGGGHGGRDHHHDHDRRSPRHA